jgi:hypothetical protein
MAMCVWRWILIYDTRDINDKKLKAFGFQR